MEMVVAVIWKTSPSDGEVSVKGGCVLNGRFTQDTGSFKNNVFTCNTNSECRLEISIDAENLGVGENPTIVTIHTDTNTFSFFARDIGSDFPIFIPDYDVAVLPAGDTRTYDEVATDTRKLGLMTNLQRIASEPEETYEEAAANTRELHHPIWMGISRDLRVFEVGLREPMMCSDWIQPRFHGNGYFWVDHEKYISPRYGFVAGRGFECTENVRRWLDEDTLPILHVERIDDDIRYGHVFFSTLEKSELIESNIRGTHFLVADGMAQCHVFNETEKAEFDSLVEQELVLDEETVLCCRIVATNTAQIPRYAFLKAPFIHGFIGDSGDYDFDPNTGFGLTKDGRVFAVSTLNGTPIKQEEIAILLKPGETATLEFIIPHTPIPVERAAELIKRDMSVCLDECRLFWQNKLKQAGSMHVPENRIDSMIQAGLLHLDLTAYGNEPDQPIAMSDGVYVPVCSEVWVHTDYLDSMGLHSLARRCLDYYLHKQQEDGLLQTFIGYMVETGAMLLAIGQHYQYTRDDAWVAEISLKVLKSCGYIVDWRNRNMKEELRGKGYGMLDGQVADPQDNERIYMLNAFAYAGLNLVAKMFANTNPSESVRLCVEAEAFKADIRRSFFESLACSPVMPIGDGTWVPTAAPWANSTGPECFGVKAQRRWSHGSLTIRDDCLGVNHLIAHGIIEPTELSAQFILDHQCELTSSRNLPSSQPYYSRHPFIHLHRDEPKQFLKAFYNGIASLADREIYSFWEHYFAVSPHKTHEEAQFLMQVRSMLYLEDKDTLRLLAGVPRVWLEDGKKIELNNAVSHFGKLSLSVVSMVDLGVIEVEITCNSEYKPKTVEIRLPHPNGQKAAEATGGVYDPERESILIKNFTGHAEVMAVFAQ